MVDADTQRRRRPGLLTLLCARSATAGLLLAALTGCVERTISITTEPPGALVYLNDEEVGRTPCDVRFLYYGKYDVRLVLDGYEPFIGSAKASMPIYELPGLDLAAELVPLTFKKNVAWHFDLEPVSADREQMIERARELRDRLDMTLGPTEADEKEAAATDPAAPKGADDLSAEPNDSRTPGDPATTDGPNDGGTTQKSE